VPFTYLGRLESEGLGMPGLPVVAVPHPVLGLTREEIADLSSQIYTRVNHILTASPEALEVEFSDWYQPGDGPAVVCDSAGCMPVYFGR
jgi:hypothetical protein